MRQVSVLGGGSWGTALAVHLGRVGHGVRLWVRDPALAADIEARRANALYLPDISLPEGVVVTDSLEVALSGADLVVSAIPSHGCRDVMRRAAPYVRRDATMVSATKGLESGTNLRMSEVIGQELRLDRAVAVLSGPSFAAEVARQLPTAVSVASVEDAVTKLVQSEFRGPSFRLYGSADVIGVEIGGAVSAVDGFRRGERHTHERRSRTQRKVAYTYGY